MMEPLPETCSRNYFFAFLLAMAALLTATCTDTGSTVQLTKPGGSTVWGIHGLVRGYTIGMITSFLKLLRKCRKRAEWMQ